MSTATAFVHPRSFPFCPSDISGSVPGNATYVDNLTLTQAMAFAWNLETFTLTTSGNVTYTPGPLIADGNSYFTLSPIASDRYTQAVSNNFSMWFGAAFAYLAFGSWPAILQPKSRVCSGSPAVNGTLLDINFEGGAGVGESEIGFWIGTDPINSGKFRIYYVIILAYQDAGTQTVTMKWDNRSGLSDLINSGSITIAGISFDWYCYKDPATSTTFTGGTLTATSTSFTY